MTSEELTKKDISLKNFKKTRNIILWVMIGVGVLFSLICLAADPIAMILIAIICGGITCTVYAILNAIYKKKENKLYNDTVASVLSLLNLSNWNFTTPYDTVVSLSSGKAVDNYDDIKYFKEDQSNLAKATWLMNHKSAYNRMLSGFLSNNEYKNLSVYPRLEKQITGNLPYTTSFNIYVSYVSPTGKSRNSKILNITSIRLNQLNEDKSILMSRADYNKYVKEQSKERLANKQHEYYEKVNSIIDFANEQKDILVNKADKDELDKSIAALFDRTVNSIKKVKSLDSEEWSLLDKVIGDIDDSIKTITDKNSHILAYYASADFITIKNTCDALMASQKEFNEYIDEKVKSISELFGTNIVRNETEIEDDYNYIHPYKKSITPFTAEVSSTVFSSAENSPLEYVIKNFYPIKEQYPEQIQKLQLLIEEIATLKEAKQIIENYKRDIQQYLSDVPAFIMENDEDGFYSRLGFATINENTLTVDYKFVYTSGAGKAQRSFTIPMTEDTIVKLIEMLESKLTMSAFTKEQRSLMTGKLRQRIKERDDYTCKYCGNSTHKEPNLLLEIDHVIPVAKGGYTEESNLQTLCWKCNRSKSDKLI